MVAGEADASNFARIMLTNEIAMSAATRLEVDIVVHGRLGRDGTVRLTEILREVDLKIVSFTEAHTAIAAEAYRKYGRGSGSPAKLNFGDCFSYALARSLDVPLLFKGDDFSATDVTAALSA
nr:type II toxin-antitoxin system VapC family toxin [Jiella avicenniae]